MEQTHAMHDAQVLIDRIWESRATSLDLSSMNLTEVPESIGRLTQLDTLFLSNNSIRKLPDSICNLTQLKRFAVTNNQLTELPDSIGALSHLKDLNLDNNKISNLPQSIEKLIYLERLSIRKNRLTQMPASVGLFIYLKGLYLDNNELSSFPDAMDNLLYLERLSIANNQLTQLPVSMGLLAQLRELNLDNNKLNDLPETLGYLKYLERLTLSENPLDLELAAAYKQGLSAVKIYLHAKAESQITLNEAKLILVGEGEVGKSCLLGALRGDAWEDKRPTTHGIEIKPIHIEHPETQEEITLNGWDFGGQRVYRPTHQLFFSAPAVYLVVWKPREGPQQGFVKEWIQLVKRREPSAKVIVVATHGGPQQRQPDIDRQELLDVFGEETLVGFFFVDSKPDDYGNRKGIEELKQAIVHVSATLPEVGRIVPQSFQEVRIALQERGVPYLSLDEVLAICRIHKMSDEIARLFITISHHLGHLTHYANDPTLRNIVILRPDWLATAMSYVLDDDQTRASNGLIRFSRLSQLWNDPSRPEETKYLSILHPVFLRLMERFDLSYKVANPTGKNDTDPLSLIGQLVPDLRPDNITSVWSINPSDGDLHQTQICRIVDAKTGQTANAEGLFYQLIVRLHKYSLGRTNYLNSVHWQRGLILDDEYNGRALLEHVGNDVRITVRAPYPERFLAMLTEEVKFLVESFWEGLRCDVTVPCLNSDPCIGLFEVRKLIENMKRGHPEQPCPVCNEWQAIDQLLHNAPTAQPDVTSLIFAEFTEVKAELIKARKQIMYVGETAMRRFDRLDDRTRRTLSRVDKTYTDFLRVLTDEAKEGPRLFSLIPIDINRFNPKTWIRAKFRLTLWCEHSRLPLNSPDLNGSRSKKGVYDFEVEREWFNKIAPYLRLAMGTLSLVLPVASTGIKLKMDDASFKAIEEQLDLGKEVIDAAIGETTKISEFLGESDSTVIEHGEAIRAQSATLRQLHVLLRSKDPGFGNLVRVMNKRQEFLWVHDKYAGEY